MLILDKEIVSWESAVQLRCLEFVLHFRCMLPVVATVRTTSLTIIELDVKACTAKMLDRKPSVRKHPVKYCFVWSVSPSKSTPSADVRGFLRCDPSPKVVIRSPFLETEFGFMFLHADFARRFLKLPHQRHLELLVKPVPVPVTHRSIVALLYRSTGRNRKIRE